MSPKVSRFLGPTQEHFGRLRERLRHLEKNRAGKIEPRPDRGEWPILLRYQKECKPVIAPGQQFRLGLTLSI